MLLEDADDFGDSFRSDLAKIHQAGQSLLGLINEILSPSKIEEGGPIDLDAFGAEARHHLRTPASAVIGYSEMLLEDEEGLDEAMTSDLRRIHDSGNKLLTLIDDILNLSRVTADEAKVALEESGVSTIIRGVVSALQPQELERPADALGGKILVVDDNEVNQDMLSRRLQREGYETATASNGREAIRMLSEQAFDLVLLDIMMPEMNGFEVLEYLKADKTLRHIPVIMISALDELDSVVRCIEMGAEDFLPKPFNPTLLRARIGACLEKKHLRDREVMYLRQIEEEKQRSDELLHVILPHSVVEELKANNKVKPRRYEEVAVLFCDIVGFTPYCANRQPEEILTNLQQLFELYEELAAQHQMYKIKTIGDSFMSTAGLIIPLDNPVHNAVRCGLDMVEGAHGLPAHWDVRVGIHVGPVMAGVVGRRQYLYDLWGDTVNTASRIESHGVKGAVCVSNAAWQRAADRFRGETRGVIPVKGKGDMEIFRVDGPA
jgi:DNA-binding response OmpR family regulator